MDALKRLKRLVREWAGIAHDRELSKALVELHAQFDRWKRGEITAWDLNDFIHRFHDGASREIWKTYATNRQAVAFAVETGILQREELPPELVQHLAGLIEFYEAGRSASSREPPPNRSTSAGAPLHSFDPTLLRRIIRGNRMSLDDGKRIRDAAARRDIPHAIVCEND